MKVHVIVYYDAYDGHITMDVFDTFEGALAKFDKSYAEVAYDHDDDYFDCFERDTEDKDLYFRTIRDYECFYREETVQTQKGE